MDSGNPYDPPTAPVDAAGTDLLAGRMDRLAAALVDGLVMAVVVLPVLYLSGMWSAIVDAAMAGRTDLGLTAMAAGMGFAMFAIVQGVPLHRSGQTWGKRLLGIRIVGMDGRQPTLTHLLTRRYLPLQVARIVPVLGHVVNLVDVLLIFRADRRCGHDLVAGTQVVKARRGSAV